MHRTKSELERIAYLAKRWQDVEAWKLSEKLAKECRQLRVSIEALPTPWSNEDFQWREIVARSPRVIDNVNDYTMLGTPEARAAKRSYCTTLLILFHRESQIEEIATAVARVLPDIGHEVVHRMSPSEWTTRAPKHCAIQMKQIAERAASEASQLPEPTRDTTFDDLIEIQELGRYGFDELKYAANCGHWFRQQEPTSSIRKAINKIEGCHNYNDAYDIIAAMKTPHERDAVRWYYEAFLITSDMAELRKCVEKTMPEMLYCVQKLDFFGDTSIDINRSAELLEELQAECEEVRKIRVRMARETERLTKRNEQLSETTSPASPVPSAFDIAPFEWTKEGQPRFFLSAGVIDCHNSKGGKSSRAPFDVDITDRQRWKAVFGNMLSGWRMVFSGLKLEARRSEGESLDPMFHLLYWHELAVKILQQNRHDLLDAAWRVHGKDQPSEAIECVDMVGGFISHVRLRFGPPNDPMATIREEMARIIGVISNHNPHAALFRSAKEIDYEQRYRQIEKEIDACVEKYCKPAKLAEWMKVFKLGSSQTSSKLNTLISEGNAEKVGHGYYRVLYTALNGIDAPNG